MKKVLLNLSLVLGVVIGGGLINPSVSSAVVQSSCDEYRMECEQVHLDRGDKIGYTRFVYVPKGGLINWGGYTEDDSLFQMGIYLYDPDLNLVDSFSVSGSGGVRSAYYTAHMSGDYHVIVKSGDSSQGRSHGTGSIKYIY